MNERELDLFDRAFRLWQRRSEDVLRIHVQQGKFLVNVGRLISLCMAFALLLELWHGIAETVARRIAIACLAFNTLCIASTWIAPRVRGWYLERKVRSTFSSSKS